MSGVTEDALGLRVTRLLGLLRLCAVGFELAVIAARPEWYLTPAHLTVPTLAAAWGVVFAVSCLRRQRLTWCLVAGEAAVGVLLAVAVTHSVPPVELAGGPNWVVLRLIGSSITLVWCVPTRFWLPYVLGVATTTVGAAHGFGGVPVARCLPPVASVVVVTVLFAVLAAKLRAGARTTDAWLAASAERERGSAVVAARMEDLRESERLVHDTVLNTLTGLSWGALDISDDEVRTRCRRDVAQCEQVLGGTDDRDETLLAGLARVTDEGRADGLTVDMAVSGDGDVPSDVASGFVAAVREAMSNVLRHATTRRVQIRVRVEADSARIDVTDSGPGFVPEAIDADRLGIRRSIIERMSDVGGVAEVRSAPGRGTTVTLHWAAIPAVTDDPAEAADVEAAYVRDAVRAVGVAVLLWQAFLGAVLVGRWGRYTDPQIVFGVWALTSAVLGSCVRTSLRGTMPGLAVVGIVAAALAGQVAAGATGNSGDPIPLNWAMLSTYGVVAFLTVVSPVRHWLPASVLVAAGSVAVTSDYLDSAPDVVTYVGIYLYMQAAIQLVVSAIGPARRQTARATARAARAEAERVSDLRAAAAVRRDRRDRLRRLRVEALPLLAAVGAGQLDPRSALVRQRCRACATTLRRTLHDSFGAGTLLDALEAAVHAAELRGVTVVTQIAGPVDELTDAGRAAVVTAVSSVLDGVAAGRAVLTVTGDGESGSAFLTFAAAPGAAGQPRPPAGPTHPAVDGTGWVEIEEDRTDGDVCVEIRWTAPR